MIQRIEYTRPPLYREQQAAFFNDQRYSWIEATTKAGKTVGAMAWLTERGMLSQPNRNYWWVAAVYSLTEIAYRRIKLGLTPGSFESNDTKLTITLPSRATMWFKSGEKPDHLYGEDVYDAVIDEASRLREESFYALRSTLSATNGKLRAIGNVKGRRNWFYKMCRKAQAGLPNHYYAKLTADDAIRAGILSQAEVDDARSVLPEKVFRELYYAEANDDMSNPFGIPYIQEMIVPDFFSNKKPVIYGVDLAKKQDWTAVIGLDETGATCFFNRFQRPWNDTIDIIADTCKGVRTIVDSTGVGDPILEALQKKARESGNTNFEGYQFTSPSKQKLMEGLAVSIQQHKIRIPSTLPNYQTIIDELNSFEYVYTRTGVSYSAPEGQHDDCVCALALANNGAQFPNTDPRGEFHVWIA